tara:strand:+ start:213 stop:509 length:297 start_codon:yes stop_codon:yes gene_type:complete
MSINANITRVVSASAATNYSGSFCKMYITEASVFDRIEFGTNHGTKFIDGYDGASKIEVSNVFNVVENVPAVAGSYIDGPIAAFKITSGGCLAYDTKS